VEQPFDRDNFPFAFLEAFGNKETTLKKLRSGDSNKSDIGGVLQRNNIHLKVCAPGEVAKTLTALRESPATARLKAKFILATDGETIEAENLADDDEPIVCSYAEFSDHFGYFLPLAGITTVKQIRESSFDIKATGRLNRLYIELLKDNPEWATAARREDLNHFMARLIFCFFAEDTDIFHGKGLFSSTVEQMSAGDPSKTGEVISELFRAMNLPIRHEGKIDYRHRDAAGIRPWANVFPYVNGGLFGKPGSADVLVGMANGKANGKAGNDPPLASHSHADEDVGVPRANVDVGAPSVPRFSRIARAYLLKIGELPWQKINPDIFGSMIQAVADDEERGALGMHYTSVPNILKVLNPLFLDDLRAKLEEAGDNPRKLLNLRHRIARIRVFDPACGSGNFLVIAYKQLREIEAEINRRRGEAERKSDIPLTNFRGIELRHFSCEIARLALIIAEYQCDVLYRGQQLALAEFLPLEAANWITCGNALRLDWLSICPPTGKAVKNRADDLFETPLDQAEIDFANEGGETYICGNPPYLGAKKKSKEQSCDMDLCGLGSAQLLDYVAAFIIKGADFISHCKASIALVSTSSICQGEQVSLLWPRILDRVSIRFAYAPFKWSNSAANNAGVYCTVVGLDAESGGVKKLFIGDQVKICDSISPYLVSGLPVICYPTKNQICQLEKMVMGSNPVDGKRLILSHDEYCEMINEDSGSRKYILKYGGTDEINSGLNRWCIWVSDDEVKNAMDIPPIARRIANCREYRKTAGRDAQKAVNRAHAFCYSTYQDEVFLNVGKVIGNTTKFVPATLREKGYVSSDAAFTIYGIRLVEFAIIVSTLHRIWAEAVSGRLGNGTRYGNTTAYNTFPVPVLTEQNKVDLTRCAEEILLAREAHFPATIAELYDPQKMPAELRAAHDRNDETLERIYLGRRFKNDTERLEKLFELYTKMTAHAPAAKKAAKRRKGGEV